MSASAVAVISALITALIILASRGKDGLKHHLKQNVAIVAVAALAGNLFWYGAILGWDVVRTVYDDHQGFVAANERLARENEGLKNPAIKPGELEKQKRLANRTGLGKLLARNNEIKDNCLSNKAPKGFSCGMEYLHWRERTWNYLSKNMDPSYLARFKATTGTHMSYKGPSGSFLEGDDSDAVNLLTFSAVTLGEFIKEFQN